MANGAARSRQASGWLALVVADRLYREPLCLELAAAGYRIAEFAAAEAALAYLGDGGPADALALDERAAAAVDDPKAALNAARAVLPVFLLAAPGEGRGTAARWGAGGLLDRGQPPETIARQLAGAVAADGLLSRTPAPDAAGPLTLAHDGAQAFWKGRRLDLSGAELALLRGLAEGGGRDLTYQRARDLLAPQEGACEGVDMDRVTTLVRRLRKKFREVDPEFDRIVLVPGCGYRWRAPAVAEA